MSEEKNEPRVKPGQFCWNELLTTDLAGAKKFYRELLGWETKPFPKSPVDYTHFIKGDDMVGGLMKTMQPGVPAHWVPYVVVEDVDASAKKAATLQAKVVLEPCDIPDVGRIAVLLDPQGAAIGLFKPLQS
jgi:predicted enzyme related to lactoylglutathione lyase